MIRNRKNVVKLTESRLRNMIKESVRQVLKESNTYQRALDGDINAWIELGVGTPGDWDKFEQWRREKLGLPSKSNSYDWKDNPNDGRQFSPEWWH